TASNTPGATTIFFPTRPQAGTAANITLDGGTTTLTVPIANTTIGTALTFIVGGDTFPAIPTISLLAPTSSDRFMPNQTYTGAVAGSVGNQAVPGSASLNVALTCTGTLSVTGLTPAQTTVAPGAFTTYTGNLVTGAATGVLGLTVTETDLVASPPIVSASQT